MDLEGFSDSEVQTYSKTENQPMLEQKELKENRSFLSQKDDHFQPQVILYKCL